MADLEELHVAVLRGKSQAQRVEASAHHQHLSRTLLDRGLYLLLNEDLAVAEALPLPRHHAILDLVDADHPRLLGRAHQARAVTG